MRRIGICCAAVVALSIAVVSVLYMIFHSSLNQNIHAGTLIAQDTYSHIFRIPNYSWRPLLVKNVSSSCGCTVVDKLPEVIPPFQTLAVPVNVNLKGRAGAFLSKVVVTFGGSSPAEFQITMDIFPLLPETIDLGRVKKGVSLKKAYAIPPEFEGARLSELHAGIKGSLNFLEGNRVLELVIEPPNRVGDFNFPLHPREGSPAVKGHVVGEIEPNLSVLSMGYLRPGAGAESTATRAVQFSSTSGAAFSWRGDITEHSELVIMKEVNGESGKSIEVQFRSPVKRGIYKELLNFQFSIEGRPEIVEVPVELYAFVMSEEPQHSVPKSE